MRVSQRFELFEDLVVNGSPVRHGLALQQEEDSVPGYRVGLSHDGFAVLAAEPQDVSDVFRGEIEIVGGSARIAVIDREVDRLKVKGFDHQRQI